MDRERIIGYVEGSGRMYKVSGDELQICCPFCPAPGDTKFKFYFNLKKQQGHCFRCNAKVGSAERFLIQVCGIPESRITAVDADRTIASYLKHVIKQSFMADQRGPAVLPLQTVRVLERRDLVLSREVLGYLKARGFSMRTIKRLDPLISFTYPNWFILPVVNFGELRFWTRRSLMRHEQLKYLSFDFKRDGDGIEEHYYKSGDVLWGIDLIKEGEPIILCEGILSAAMVTQQDLSAVGLLGSTISKAQRALLRTKNPPQLIVALDGKKPGANTLRKTADVKKMLYDHFPRVDVMTLPDKMDPNDLGRDFRILYNRQILGREGVDGDAEEIN